MEALRVFQENPAAFALVITDLTMPHMTGLDLARQMTRVRAVPVVILTGHAEGLDPAELADAGVQRLVVKPLSIDELGRAVREALTPQQGSA